MNRLVRLVLAPLGIVGAMAALGAAPAAAQESNPFEKNVFEVEAKTLYCQGGGTACVAPHGDVNRLRFVDLSVFRFSPVSRSKEDEQAEARGEGKRASGTPELVHAVCATHYVDAKGDLHARSIDVTVADGKVPSGGPPVPQGRIEGTASVLNGSEQSRFALGAIHVRASTKDSSVEIEGLQATNNQNDTRIFGGFDVEMRGLITDFDITTNTPFGKPAPGTMSCRSNVTPVTATTPPLSDFAAPPDFTSEVNDPGDPSDPS
jgi:hypothetical protein